MWIKRVVTFFGLAVLGLVTAAAVARSDEPVRLRAGWINTPSSLMPILFAKPGIAKHQGVTYRLDPVFFASSPLEITALAAGELEIAPLGYTSFSIAIENAGLDDLRIIADEARDGFDDYSTVEYRVLTNGPVKTIEDLKGKVLATNGIGSGADMGMRAMLLRHGLADTRDYTVVEARFANMEPMLEAHKVDLSMAPLPFKYDPQIEAQTRILFTLKQAFGQTELSFWTVRADFLAKHRAALTDLLEDTIRAVRWYIDPANHQEAVDILARFTKRPPATVADWAFTKKDNYRDPNALPDLTVLQQNIHAQKELGFVKADLDVARYADLSLVEAAAKRLQ